MRVFLFFLIFLTLPAYQANAQTKDSVPPSDPTKIGVTTARCSPAPSPTIGTAHDFINFDVGFKAQTETDYDAGGLTFSRTYRSDSTWTDNTVGALWRHNYARTLTVTSTAASITDGTGATITYTSSGGNWVPDDPSTTARFQTTGSTYVYTLPDNTVEKYNASKRLSRIEYLGGGALNLGYNGSGQLTSVANENNRQLTMTYASGRLATLVTPDGTYSYTYSSGKLTKVTRPDTKFNEYFYENGSFVNALTGIKDATGVRFSSVTYNGSGKATLSEYAGNVEDYAVSYGSSSSTTTNPLNKNTTYNFTNIQGVRRIVQVDGAASPNCVASNRYYNYDALGRLIGKTDWENNTTRYSYDARGNITQVTEAQGTADERTRTVTYDATFNLPDLVTIPGKTTDYDYDTYGRLVTMTETDTATAVTRITTYAYHANTTDGSGNLILGRLSQVDGPRTDVSDITQYAYDANRNLTRITNALGQETDITQRDAAGPPDADRRREQRRHRHRV